MSVSVKIEDELYAQAKVQATAEHRSIAGQIGRIADLHGFAARRVRDRDVPHASRLQGCPQTPPSMEPIFLCSMPEDSVLGLAETCS